MDSPQERSLTTQIALGYIASLLVQTIVLLMMVVDSLLTEVSTNFQSLHRDPSHQALRILVYIVAYYALMPVYVFVVNRFRSRLPRWIAVAVAFLTGLFLLLHHLSHWFLHQRPDFTSHVLDLTLHVISLWIIVNSIRWARVPAPAADAVYGTTPVTAS